MREIFQGDRDSIVDLSVVVHILCLVEGCKHCCRTYPTCLLDDSRSSLRFAALAQQINFYHAG